VKATKQNTKAIFDIMERNLVLVENLVRETRETFDQARRMIGMETEAEADASSEADFESAAEGRR
jgi:hypothetical protein